MAEPMAEEETRTPPPLFSSAPVGLTALPLLGREDAIYETFKLLFERWFTRKNQMTSDRTESPLLFFPAAPGLGKTRMLNVLTRVPKRPSDETRLAKFLEEGSNLHAQLEDDELKWAAIEAIRRNQGNMREQWVYSSEEDVERFCDLMIHQTCGIIVTFNEQINLATAERKGELLASEMLGVRIAFEAQLVDGCNHQSFDEFLISLRKVLGDQRPTLSWALTRAFQKFGEETHIILGVDEVLRGAGITDHDQYVKGDVGCLPDMLNALGVVLDKHRNLSVVLSSLSCMRVDGYNAFSRRTIRTVNLRNLEFEESITLAEWYHTAQKLRHEQRWIDDEHAIQIVSDCDGAPRLLEKVFAFLRPRRSLEELRELCFQVCPVSNLTAERDL